MRAIRAPPAPHGGSRSRHPCGLAWPQYLECRYFKDLHEQWQQADSVPTVSRRWQGNAKQHPSRVLRPHSTARRSLLQRLVSIRIGHARQTAPGWRSFPRQACSASRCRRLTRDSADPSNDARHPMEGVTGGGPGGLRHFSSLALVYRNDLRTCHLDVPVKVHAFASMQRHRHVLGLQGRAPAQAAGLACRARSDVSAHGFG